MPWFTKKERRMQVSDFLATFKADFGRFRSISAVFRPISAVSAAGRYDPIWPIRLDFGRISPVRRESKPIQHELSRIGTNRAESVWIREKKKKKTQMRSDTRATTSDAASLVGRSCDTSGAASVLSRQGFIREVNLLGIWYTELEFMKINPSIFLCLIWIQMLRQP